MCVISTILSTAIFTFYMFNRNMKTERQVVADSAAPWIIPDWILDQYILPVVQNCVAYLCTLYLHCTAFNVAAVLLKYVPISVYIYKVWVKIYSKRRERLKKQQTELEDIQLQIQIMETKSSVREAEVYERKAMLRRASERMRNVRGRVRQLIAADEVLQRVLQRASVECCELGVGEAVDSNVQTLTQACEQYSGDEYIMELIRELKYDRTVQSTAEETEPHTPENGVYSSLSDTDMKKDCKVKIVKVTNVYRVAYLRHYIKQRRLRRANKQALLKKKIESIKKLLDSWQTMLSMVINNKRTLLENQHIEVASQEAMGDYSKPNVNRESSDSDSEIKNDGYYDHQGNEWPPNCYRKYNYNFEDTETAVSREYCSTEIGDGNFGTQCECNGPKGSNVLFLLPEETSSQIAIEEMKSELEDHCECHDLVVL